MARKKDVVPAAPRPDKDWIISTEITINNRQVVKDTELKISGERGRFRFMKHVNNNGIEWVDVWGGKKGSECIRSFRPDRIKTVHYKNTTDKNLVKIFKEKKKLLKES